MGRQLPRRFFTRPTLTVAHDMLGKILCRRTESGNVLRVRIAEVEAYCGEDDTASHASRGRTKRTELMYAPPGTVYVYLVYGMYHCLNIVTEKKDFPAAVLIRGGTPLQEKIAERDLCGPGRLCRTLDITKKENGTSIINNPSLWISDDNVQRPDDTIIRTPRIGVDYAGEAAAWDWRLVIKAFEQKKPSKR